LGVKGYKQYSLHNKIMNKKQGPRSSKFLNALYIDSCLPTFWTDRRYFLKVEAIQGKYRLKTFLLFFWTA